MHKILIAALIVTEFAHAQAGRAVNPALNPGEWTSYGLTPGETRYSPLNQINTSNVARLGLNWSFEVGKGGGNQEATPLYANGTLYSITNWSIVFAVDARTGKEKWRWDPEVNQDKTRPQICCGVVNRGLAMYQNLIIAPVIDGRLLALNAETGKPVWEARVSYSSEGYTVTMAPRIAKGKVIIGVAGAELPIRGFFSAFDAATGKLAWKFYTVPGDPSKPVEQPELADWAKTWSGEWWKIGGGGPVWNGMAYDPESDIVYVGTGQPGPWTSMHRGKGDNLCTDCIIAVRGATGKYIWHYQTTPGDDWDFDSIADIMLADLNINGRQRHVVMHAPKNGFFYVLDSRTGELLSADPWVTVNWASGVDLKTGRPRVNPEARYGTDAVSITPGPGGGHVWPPWSFNPATGLVYIPSTIGGGYTFQANPEFVPLPTDIGPDGRGQMNMGTGAARGAAGRGGAAAGGGRGGAAPAGLAPGLDPTAVAAAGGAGRGAAPAGAPGGGRGPAPPSPPSIGPEGRGNILVAWDPVAGKERWRGLSAGFNQGGTLSTAGNLVFASVNTRLLVYRADNGDQLMDITTGLSQMGPPMTFMLDGKQYVAIAGGPPPVPGAGGRGGGRGAAPPAPGAAPAAPPQPSRMLVYTLDGKATLPAPPTPAAPAQ